MLRTFPSSPVVSVSAASDPDSVAGAAAPELLLSVDVVSDHPPHPATIVATMDAHNNALMIFFFIENPPP